MCDILLFHTEYTTLQYGGIGFLFGIYIFQGLKFIFYDRKREAKRAEKKRMEIERLDEALA